MSKWLLNRICCGACHNQSEGRSYLLDVARTTENNRGSLRLYHYFGAEREEGGAAIGGAKLIIFTSAAPTNKKAESVRRLGA
jgi:hypothetical protein